MAEISGILIEESYSCAIMASLHALEASSLKMISLLLARRTGFKCSLFYVIEASTHFPFQFAMKLVGKRLFFSSNNLLDRVVPRIVI